MHPYHIGEVLLCTTYPVRISRYIEKTRHLEELVEQPPINEEYGDNVFTCRLEINVLVFVRLSAK